MNSNKLKSIREISRIAKRLQRAGKKIVFTNGCFDILHVGHVRYLREARALGDILVLGLNRDRSVKGLKGPDRPVTREAERAEVLSALESVDYVVLFSEPTPEKLIRAVRPDFLVKGGDWKIANIVGSSYVQSYGGKALSLRFAKGYSTTRLIKKISSLNCSAKRKR